MHALEITVALPPDQAEAAVRDALDPSVGPVLPCNVVIEPTEAGTRIAIADPRELMSDPACRELAEDGARRLQAALDAIGDHQEGVAS